MHLVDLLWKYNFMYEFLGYWNIESDFLIFGIEEANFSPDPQIELDTRLAWKNWSEESIPFNAGYYHPWTPGILNKNIPYWQNWLRIINKISKNNKHGVEDVFFSELKAFPKPYDATLSTYYGDLNIKNSTLYPDSGKHRDRMNTLRELILQWPAKVILLSWYESEVLKLFNITPIDFMDGSAELSLPYEYLGIAEKDSHENHKARAYCIYEADWKLLITVPHLSRISPERLEEVVDGIDTYLKNSWLSYNF